MPATQYCKRAFSSADGDFLIVPQEGTLIITTEFGKVSIFAILLTEQFKAQLRGRAHFHCTDSKTSKSIDILMIRCSLHFETEIS